MNYPTSRKLALGLGLTAALLGSNNALAACGSDPMLGAICMVGFTFCPRGFHEADGSLLAISSHTALFSLLGTTYGGDGKTTFALPDLRGRTPVGFGQGPGLNGTITQGQKLGQESVTLGQDNMPIHAHGATFVGDDQSAPVNIPVSDRSASNSTVPTASRNHLAVSTGGPGAAAIWSDTSSQIASVGGATTNITPGGQITINNAGGSVPFNNRPPQLGVRYCIALQGLYPSRN